MTKPYLHNLGHLIAISHANHENHEKMGFLSRLWSENFAGQDVFKRIEELLKGYEEGVRAVEEATNEDRIAEHEVHVSVNGVEMWMQSLEIVLQEYYEEAQLLNIMGEELHGPNHTLTVVAQGVRLIELIRTSPNLIMQLGGRELARDAMNRGWTLLSRLYKSMNWMTSQGVFVENRAEVAEFFVNLDTIAHKASKEELTLLVYAGYVPQGRGLPVGGSGFNIELHKRAQGSIPDQSEKKPTSGWSIGRFGNKENIGIGRENNFHA